jgi:hypothetical protein
VPVGIYFPIYLFSAFDLSRVCNVSELDLVR